MSLHGGSFAKVIRNPKNILRTPVEDVLSAQLYLSREHVHRTKEVTQSVKFVSWNPTPLDVLLFADDPLAPRRSSNSNHAGTTAYSLLYNSQANYDRIGIVCDKARQMAETRAYLFWYERYYADFDFVLGENLETLRGICDVMS